MRGNLRRFSRDGLLKAGGEVIGGHPKPVAGSYLGGKVSRSGTGRINERRDAYRSASKGAWRGAMGKNHLGRA